MGNDIAIKSDSLSKRYHIGADNFTYVNIRDRLADMFNRPSRVDKRIIWALEDVSFSVKRGEILGVIGRNGAGKSTLLKILSRITPPTKGSIEIKGRVGSLLEVGTGFHEELTGRENIYFNGAVLGMKKREIDKNFDQIVEFAEISKFLDTPIKRYSTGMSMRLAFAIAAHLETDILLVDEVLAVGDTRFQKKCFEKMSGVIKTGKTVLFVSHNLSAINALCSSVMLLDGGRLIAHRDKCSVINKYMDSIYNLTQSQLSSRTDRQGDARMIFTDYWLEDNSSNRLKLFYSGQDVVIAVRYISKPGIKLTNVSVAFALSDQMGIHIADLANRVSAQAWPEIPGSGVIRCRIPKLPLVPGIYSFNVFAQVNSCLADWVQNAGKFEVQAGDFYRTGLLPDSCQGNLLIEHEWSVA
ncbi:MAG: ABC transporter ATP-binding protein [Candidatus Omnitrophica bacterium]|nr:ABC transporter ATP-binding protein [Candidatus Omnitrophota bacterium]